MENIDPIFIVQPVVVIAASTGLLVYWHRRRGFKWMVLLYSLAAYAVAIGLKYAVQIPTINGVTDYFGQQSVGLGAYYGAQTAFFEVGMAYAVAVYAVKRGRLRRRDAEGYGAGLAFWESAVLLGALSLVNLIAYYAILSSNQSVSQTVYDLLSKNAPGLFNPPAQAIRSVFLGTLERVSSILVHLAWGYLCVMAAVFGRRRLFVIAVPMGFIDFLVPFSPVVGPVVFEAILFAIAVASVLVAYFATRSLPKTVEASPQVKATGSGQDSPGA